MFSETPKEVFVKAVFQITFLASTKPNIIKVNTKKIKTLVIVKSICNGEGGEGRGGAGGHIFPALLYFL